MGTRVLSLWLPYLSIDRIRQKSRGPAYGRRALPQATCLDADTDQPLVALCPRAEQAGLRPGMDRADAMARVPGLVTFPADIDADRQFLAACASWCERYTPFVATDQSHNVEQGGALWLDIGSAAHLSGGEASLLARVLGRCRKEGLTAKAAIADHPGSAWAACRFGHDEQRILPANGARVALAPWPMAALRLTTADCETLESAGLDRIEHLYALPRHSLRARFGGDVARRLDQALGLVDEPIAVDTPLPAQQAQMIFAEPITEADKLPPLIERLLHQLCVGLEAAGLGLRRLTLALYRVDNSTVTCSVGYDHPTRDIHRLQALIGEQVDRIDLGFGLERAILDAVDIEPLLPESVHWRGLGTAADDPLPDLAFPNHAFPNHAFNDGPFRDELQRHREKRQQATPWQRQGGGEHTLPPFLAAGQTVRPQPSIAGSHGSAALALTPTLPVETVPKETMPRPLRLLRQPEPIEAIASLPGEPPVLFRWRQQLHKVIGARGPEIVTPDWWQPLDKEPSSTRSRSGGRDDGRTGMRDYFAVEDSEGGRFWLFREGSDKPAACPLPRWFLHGVFG